MTKKQFERSNHGRPFLLGILCVSGLLLLNNPAFTQTDSSKILPKVTLTATKKRTVIVSAFPANQLSKDELSRVNSTSVADAARLFPGTNVKDYGGIGGLKTISIRSLGANHTGVMYDGLMVSDMQGGQVDLGKFSATHVESVALFNAQPNTLLLPARAYASAATMAINTGALINQQEKSWQLNGALRAGSFGFINPAIAMNMHNGKKTNHRLHAEYQGSNGAYPFKGYENSREKVNRQNADAKNIRSEYDATVFIHDSSIVRFKAYQFFSDRGLPGSVIFFNPESRQRLTDRDLFTQATWNHSISAKSHFLLSAKYSNLYKLYVDPDFLNSRGRLENRFHEKEWYGSAAFKYNILNNVDIAFASDIFKTSLRRSGEFIGDSANPVRMSWLNNIAASWKLNRLNIQGNVLSSMLNDRLLNSEAGKQVRKITPALAVMYQPFDSIPLQVRAFYKKIFRAPTFNDLYYTFVGNINLRPEIASQYNLGLTYNINRQGVFKNIGLSADAYYNHVTDKIMAVPRQNLFQWSMMNVGKVDIKGLDATVIYELKKIGNLEIAGRFVYTYQEAIDISKPGSASYKNQLPYTPKHSGSVQAAVRYKTLSISYNGALSSFRYRPGDQIPENLVESWATHDIRVSVQKFSTNKTLHQFFAEFNNIMNSQYEIIRFYPMPGFNFRVGYTVNIQSKQSTKNKT